MPAATLSVMTAAAFVWYSGGIALFLKAGSLIKSAAVLCPESFWPAGAALLGISAGLINTKFIFNHACIKNIIRIKSLPAPRMWQCFRPGMIIFLAIIIPTGAMMSRMASGKFVWLCTVAALDLSIGTALLCSGLQFLKLKAFQKKD